jgi:hypothetical protein
VRPIYRNWISLAGAIIAAGGLFAFLLLFAIDLFAHHGNPYMGILACVVAPFFIFLGAGLVAGGWWWERRQARLSPPGGGTGRFVMESIPHPRPEGARGLHHRWRSLPAAHRHRKQPNLSLHGISPVLWPSLPYPDEAGVCRLP